MMHLPPDPRENPTDRWTLQQLLAYEPVVEALKGERSLLAISRDYIGLEQGNLSRLIKYVARFDDSLLPERLRKKSDSPRRAGKAQTQVNTYPVYGAVKAGAFDETLPTHDSEPVGSYYTKRDLRSGEKGEPFALTVVGLSMTDGASAVEFPEGSKVLVNPNAEPVPGDYVVAMDIRDGSTTLKRFMRLDQAFWLKPLNREFRPTEVTEYHRIVGVIEEATLPLYERA